MSNLTAHYILDHAADAPAEPCEVISVPVVGWVARQDGSAVPVLAENPGSFVTLLNITGDRTMRQAVRTKYDILAAACQSIE